MNSELESDGATQAPQSRLVGKSIDYQKGPDFIERYANNVFLEPTAWDLKLKFGQADVSAGDNVVSQHVAITLPWAQAKVLAYFLQIHISSHESQLGKVPIPKNVIPEIPEIPEVVPNDLDIEAYRTARRLYLEFIAANPEAVVR